MLNFIKKPERFTPSGNPIIFQVESDNPDTVIYTIQVIDVNTDVVVNITQTKPNPKYLNGAYIDLSKILDNTISWQIDTSTFDLVKPISKAVRKYRVKITEGVMNQTTGIVSDGDVYDDDGDIFYVFNAKLGRIDFANYLQLNYVINPSSQVQWLTFKPNYTKVTDLSTEHLYFLQSGSVSFLFLRVKLFSKSGGLIKMVSKPVPSLSAYQMYRVNVSPKALRDGGDVDDWSTVDYYTVDISDHLGQSRTVERVYKYQAAECHKEYMNVLWINSTGGLDAYPFISPKDSIDVSRFNIKRNVYGINTDNIYSDMEGNIFNPSDVIISNRITTTTRLSTENLSDSESYWLMELYMSKQVFIELSDGSLVPAMLNGSNYNVQRQKYSGGQLIFHEIELTLTDGVIPAGAAAFSSGKLSVEFIDEQMNTISTNIPGFEVIPDVEDDTQYNKEHYSHNYK